jgi:cell division protein ZapE
VTAQRNKLRTLYLQQIENRCFREDPAQLHAIDRLELLRARLARAQKSRSSLLLRLGSGLQGAKTRPGSAGVYLWGGVGRGKTWLMDLFFQSVTDPLRRRSHFHRFMHDVHAELKRQRKRADPLAFVADRIAADAHLICFDELYVSDIADAMILGQLFRHLIGRGTALVITSNVAPRDLYANGLQRQRFVPTIGLLESSLDVVAVDGSTDYRLRQLTQAPIYLDSADPSTSANLLEIFEDLADGPGTSGGHIEIEGRQLPVVRASENVAWFAFRALCDGPRSQNDYIEISREYQSVIVEDVPQFDAASDNAARRFIALVDEFYDRNVKLVVSAAAPAAGLYRGERLTLEFARTSSRLTEMQSKQYLAREHRA